MKSKKHLMHMNFNSLGLITFPKISKSTIMQHSLDDRNKLTENKHYEEESITLLHQGAVMESHHSLDIGVTPHKETEWIIF
jgi:hypothetical protein